MRSIIGPYDQKKKVQFNTTGPSSTHQEFMNECDINRIMEKWQKTGVLEHQNRFQGSYADFTNTPEDYHQAMNSVVQAQEMFLTLPANIRKKFANDPGLFLDFVDDPDNISELIELGLAKAVPQATKTEKTTEGEPTKNNTSTQPPPVE